MILATLLVIAALTSLPPVKVAQSNSGCLHEAGRETPEHRDRSVAALGATRAINSAQAAHAAKNKVYASRHELQGDLDAARYNMAESAEIAPGFKLTLDTTPKGYWFEIVDQKDPCGFRYISNQNGVIFAAQPIR